MPLVDIILLVLIGSFALAGLWFGFVHTLGSLVGTLVGAYLASRYYEPLADWLITWTGWSPNAARVVMFIVAFIIINRLVGLVFWIIDKVLSIVTRLPFISSINRLLGFILGIAEGVITVGLVIFFIERIPLSNHIMGYIAVSKVAPMVAGVAAILWPLLPEAFRMLQSTVDFVEGKVK